MDFVITPYKSFGNIPFGLHRNEVRMYLRDSYREFYRSHSDKVPTDFFEILGLFIYYDEDLLCEAIEVIQPANPILFSLRLLNLSYQEVEEQILEWDKEVNITKTGFTSFKLGFGAYAPNKFDFPDEISESVIIFKKGYYD